MRVHNFDPDAYIGGYYGDSVKDRSSTILGPFSDVGGGSYKRRSKRNVPKLFVV